MVRLVVIFSGRVVAKDGEGGVPVRSGRGETRLGWSEALGADTAEGAAIAPNRRWRIRRSEPPSFAALRCEQLAVHSLWRLAGECEAVGEGPVTEPSDMAEPIGIREVEVKRSRNIEAVGPVFG